MAARRAGDSALAQRGLDTYSQNAALPDAGRRRYVTLSQDFDLRVRTLEMEIQAEWDPHVKAQWSTNQDKVRQGLVAEYGADSAKQKEANFLAIGPLSMSVIAYHNGFHRQVRGAFVMGHYYPALVGACALGERILNHFILDLRQFFRATPAYKRVHNKQSFDNWTAAIDALQAWGVFLPETVAQYRALSTLRNRSIHFDVDTYGRLRDDALEAVLAIAAIIDLQFSTFAVRPWFIPGSAGACFIRKAFETDPFVRTYLLPNCLFVGPHYIFRSRGSELVAYDTSDYGLGAVSDDEFQIQFRDRKPEDLPPDDGRQIGDARKA